MEGYSQYLLSAFERLLSGKLKWAEVCDRLMETWGSTLLWLLAFWYRLPWNSGKGRRTPSEQLGLKPGEWVRVRSAWNILKTLGRGGYNRGLAFKPEMFRYCGRTYRVLARINSRIHEQTALMVVMTNPCIILETVHCHGTRICCTRTNYHYWHEIWLERCNADPSRPEASASKGEQQVIGRAETDSSAPNGSLGQQPQSCDTRRRSRLSQHSVLTT